MSRKTIRDTESDQLLSPEHAAVLVIDHQPPQLSSIGAMDWHLLSNPIEGYARSAILYGLPIVQPAEALHADFKKPPVSNGKEPPTDASTQHRTNVNNW